MEADRYLYRNVTLYMCKDSLNNLRNIASTSHLAKTVQALLIEGDHAELLEYSVFRELWAERAASESADNPNTIRSLIAQVIVLGISQPDDVVYTREKRDLQRLDHLKQLAGRSTASVDAEIHQFHDWHTRLAKEAASMKSDGSMRRALVMLFRNCKNLRTIRYSSANTNWPQTLSQHKLFKKGYIIPFGLPHRLV